MLGVCIQGKRPLLGLHSRRITSSLRRIQSHHNLFNPWITFNKSHSPARSGLHKHTLLSSVDAASQLPVIFHPTCHTCASCSSVAITCISSSSTGPDMLHRFTQVPQATATISYGRPNCGA